MPLKSRGCAGLVKRSIMHVYHRITARHSLFGYRNAFCRLPTRGTSNCTGVHPVTSRGFQVGSCTSCQKVLIVANVSPGGSGSGRRVVISRSNGTTM